MVGNYQTSCVFSITNFPVFNILGFDFEEFGRNVTKITDLEKKSNVTGHFDAYAVYQIKTSVTNYAVDSKD